MPLKRIPPGSKYGDESKYSEADSLLKQGKLPEALESLGNDSDPPALIRRSRWMGEMAIRDKEISASEKLDRCRNALAFAVQAVEKDPSYPVGYKDVAISLARITDLFSPSEKAQNSKDMKAALDKAIQLDPGDSATWLVLGKWHVGIAGLSWMAHAAIKLIYGGMPEASYEDAVRCFLKAEECYSNPMNLLALAQVYLTMNKREEARQTLIKAIASSDELPVYRDAIEEAKQVLNKEFP